MGQRREEYLDEWKVTSDLLALLAVLNKELQKALTDSCNLATTQYRILLKLHEMGGKARVRDVAKSLGFKPNAVSQAATSLQKGKLVRRVKDSTDKRAIFLVLTAKGVEVVDFACRELSQHFSKVWKVVPSDIAFNMHDTIRYIGAVIEGHNPETNTDEFSSEYITTIAESYNTVTSTLKLAGLTLNECRMLYTIQDIGGTARMVTLAGFLLMPANTATWMADQLVERDYVLRNSSGNMNQGVFLELTEQGIKVLSDGIEAVSALCRTRLWRGLTREQMASIFKAASAFANAMREQTAE